MIAHQQISFAIAIEIAPELHVTLEIKPATPTQQQLRFIHSYRQVSLTVRLPRKSSAGTKKVKLQVQIKLFGCDFLAYSLPRFQRTEPQCQVRKTVPID